ncbi:YybH family protein [Cupriavidus sp. CuC1]|uniref:YybH family protein n=1 Tax=Cupriavidus TaxID=106589 RepID=UPI00296B146C|nr:nuclear transport factor 2 family protein [Cupriavidus sp. CV2]MDW3682076.1 nuclear transport factor 2 family protein [Cupriavidus sp. CV2]
MRNRTSFVRHNLLSAFSFSLLTAVTSAHAAEVTATDTQEIHDLFLRQADAETAHDIDALDGMLAHAVPGQPDPVSFVARAYRFWGRDAVMEHFRKTFTGTWRFEPDQSAISIIPLNGDTVQIYAPTRITLGAAGQPAKTATFLINEFVIRTPSGWKISAVVPVPAE